MEFFSNALLLLAMAVLIVLFFREDRRFPRGYQLWLGFSPVAKVAELTLSLHLGKGSAWDGAPKVVADLHAKLGLGVLQSVIAAIVWISYFELSERVKTTFVH